MNESVYKAIDNVLQNAPPNTSISTIINNITMQCNCSLDFKDVTKIVKLVEPQVSNRNVLRLLTMEEQK